MFSKYWLGATALVCGSLLQAADVALSANIRVIEEIVAKVNNDIITRGELEKTRAQLEAEIRSQKGLSGPELDKEVRQHQSDALRDQIDQLLLVQKGKDLGVKVDADVTRRMADIQTQDCKCSDPEKFREWIRENAGGQSFEDVKQQMTNQFLTQSVIRQEVGRNINVPQADLQKYYDEHKKEFVREEMVFLREILIAPTDKTPAAKAAAEKKAKDIVARARKGEKFPQLARDYSANPETAKSDGELPPFKRGTMRKELEDAVFGQNKGYITEPIDTPAGFEILKVEERYAPGQAALEDVKNEIMERLYTPRLQPALRVYLTKLRQDAFLEIRGGYVDSGASPGKDTAWKDPATLKPETTTKEEVASRKKKKFLGVIPHISTGNNPNAIAPPPLPPPTTTPVSSTPVAPPQ